jgi:hypothetical protein
MIPALVMEGASRTASAPSVPAMPIAPEIIAPAAFVIPAPLLRTTPIPSFGPKVSMLPALTRVKEYAPEPSETAVLFLMTPPAALEMEPPETTETSLSIVPSFCKVPGSPEKPR